MFEGYSKEQTEKLLVKMHYFSVEEVLTLIRAGADPNARDECGRNLLHYSLSHDEVEKLIAAGVEQNAQDRDGTTPLHVSTEPGVTELLLAAGADPHARDIDGRTPLHMSASCYKESVPLLLAAGADPNARDKLGMSPLHYAADTQWIVIKKLIDAGAIIDMADKKGRTPLHIAAMGGGYEVEYPSVGFLLALGANPTIRDADGKLPEEVASCLAAANLLAAKRTKKEARELAAVAKEGKSEGRSGRRRI